MNPMSHTNQKHAAAYPNARKIRRSCNRELYRAVKRLNKYIPPQLMDQAEELYFKKVVLNLPFIVENGSNRKALCDWWDENVSADIAALWEVDEPALRIAFRDAFGG